MTDSEAFLSTVMGGTDLEAPKGTLDAATKQMVVATPAPSHGSKASLQPGRRYSHDNIILQHAPDQRSSL